MFLYVNPATLRVAAFAADRLSTPAALTKSGALKRVEFKGTVPTGFKMVTCNNYVLAASTLVESAIPASEYDAITLLRNKFLALRTLQNVITSVRSAYNKTIILQAKAYALKLEEAQRYIADATNGTFPLLTASAQAHGQTLEQEAVAVVNAAEQEAAVLTATESARMVETANILAATTVDAVTTIRSRLTTAYVKAFTVSTTTTASTTTAAKAK